MKTYVAKVTKEYIFTNKSREEIEELFTDGDIEDYDANEINLEVVDCGEDLSKNEYGVPYHKYEIFLENGEHFNIDVASEDDWGDIQECTHGDCNDWEDSVGWGNDSEGHVKIRKVIDHGSGDAWIGNKAVSAWYRDCVSCYVDNYSA